MKFLKNKYGANMEVLKQEKEFVNIFNTKWYKDIKSSLTPGETLKIYRENIRLTQSELGKNLEGLPDKKYLIWKPVKEVLAKRLPKN